MITLIVAANTGVARTANANIAGIAVAISQAAGVCNYSINPAGQGFPVAGGTGGVDITTSPGCNWSASTPVGWVTLTSTATGSGSGRVTYQVAANTGAARSAALTIAGRNFRVDQSAASIPGLSTAGTLAQVASAGYWTTTFTLVNTGAAAAQVRISFYDDNGAALVLPLTFPQNELGGPLLASTLDRTLNAGASLLIATTGPDNAVVQQGWAQVASDGTVAVSAVLRLKAGTVDQEAVVPLETRSAAGYLLAFDNTNDYSTGIALANTVAQAANFNVIIKDDAGVTLLTTTQDVPTMGHKSFDLAVRFPAAALRRGTVEFRGVTPGQVSVLGLRFNPKGSFTTIPPTAR